MKPIVTIFYTEEMVLCDNDDCYRTTNMRIIAYGPESEEHPGPPFCAAHLSLELAEMLVNFDQEVLGR